MTHAQILSFSQMKVVGKMVISWELRQKLIVFFLHASLNNTVEKNDQPSVLLKSINSADTSYGHLEVVTSTRRFRVFY